MTLSVKNIFASGCRMSSDCGCLGCIYFKGILPDGSKVNCISDGIRSLSSGGEETLLNTVNNKTQWKED